MARPCGPVAVAATYGAHCSRLDGSPLHHNNANPSLPDLLISRPELEAMVEAAIGDLST
jgi:3'(2'), 5'-bisphosphate nucleotidase